MALSKAKQSELNRGLFEACKIGDLENVKESLNKGADVNAFDGESITEASSKGHAEIVKVLIENGADVNNESGYFDDEMDEDEALLAIQSPLFEAAQNGHLEVVRVLIENGADIHAQNDRAMMEASQFSNVEVVKLLHKNGADIDVAIQYAHSDKIKKELIDYKNFGQEKEILEKDLEPLKQTQIVAPSRRI